MKTNELTALGIGINALFKVDELRNQRKLIVCKKCGCEVSTSAGASSNGGIEWTPHISFRCNTCGCHTEIQKDNNYDDILIVEFDTDQEMEYYQQLHKRYQIIQEVKTETQIYKNAGLGDYYKLITKKVGKKEYVCQLCGDMVIAGKKYYYRSVSMRAGLYYGHYRSWSYYICPICWKEEIEGNSNNII